MGDRRDGGRSHYRLSPIAYRLLPDDLDAHAAGGAFDLLLRAIEVDGVEILEFQFGDLAQLRRRDPPDLVLARVPGTLVDPGGAAQQVGRGRGLGDEGERAILEDGDDDRDDLPGQRRGALVIFLDEVH